MDADGVLGRFALGCGELGFQVVDLVRGFGGGRGGLLVVGPHVFQVVLHAGDTLLEAFIFLSSGIQLTFQGVQFGNLGYGRRGESFARGG